MLPKGNKYGIKPEHMTPEVWDFIFYKDKPMPKNCKISKVRLASNSD